MKLKISDRSRGDPKAPISIATNSEGGAPLFSLDCSILSLIHTL